MAVWILSRSSGGNDVFIYDGTILPSVPLLIAMYHGLVDAKLDTDGLYYVRSSVFDLDTLSLITLC